MFNFNYPDPGFFTATSLIQLGYSIWANLSMISIGLALEFSSVTIPQLNSPDSSFMLTTSEQSWIASVLMLAVAIGCLVSGYFTDEFGRKSMLIYSHLPVCVGWVYTGFGSNAKQLILGRVIVGIGLGFIMSVPWAYTTEISLPNMRGILGSLPNLAISVGITLQASIGSYMNWRISCFLCAAYELTLFFFNFLLPESPYFLLKMGSVESAKEALKKFRSNSYNTDVELKDLIDFKTENEIRSLSCIELMERIFSRSACRPFAIIMTYFLITQLSGVTILIFWGIEMLQRSKSSVDPRVGNIILGLIRIIAGLFTSTLIFRFGRRPLALISGLGVGIICIVLGIYIHYDRSHNMFPQLCYVSYIMFATIGHYTLPVLIMYELYPLQIRGILGGISVSNMCFLIFAVNICYPHVREMLGFSNTITSFGICSLLGCIYLYFCLPETKGLTLQEIEGYYNEIRPTLTSQRRIISMPNLNRSVSNLITPTKRTSYDVPTSKLK